MAGDGPGKRIASVKRFGCRGSWTIRLKPEQAYSPNPVSLSDAEAECKLAKSSGGNSGITFDYGSGKLRFDVNLFAASDELNRNLPWHETHTNKVCIGWSEILTNNVRPYTLDLLIVFNPPPSGPPPLVRDWFRRFYPGGLPTLGKRR